MGPFLDRDDPFADVFPQSPQCCSIHNDAMLPNRKLDLPLLLWLLTTNHIASNAMIFITMRNHAVTVHPVGVMSDSTKESLTICQPCQSGLHCSENQLP